jgi:CheY-like chemotaxis protein
MKAGHQMGNSEQPELRTRRVLVVDDEPEIRDTVADVLSAEGYSVQTAPNGLEALRHVAAEPVDLVLIDLMMPVMDGWVFESMVRQNPKTAHMPVVAVSALPPDVRAPGFNARLHKPFDLDQLLNTVEQMCRTPVIAG